MKNLLHKSTNDTSNNDKSIDKFVNENNTVKVKCALKEYEINSYKLLYVLKRLGYEKNTLPKDITALLKQYKLYNKDFLKNINKI